MTKACSQLNSRSDNDAPDSRPFISPCCARARGTFSKRRDPDATAALLCGEARTTRTTALASCPHSLFLSTFIMAYYNNPPPPYPGTTGKAAPPTYEDPSTQPLLGQSAAGRSGVYDHSAGEFPDDFLVCTVLFVNPRVFLTWALVRDDCRRMCTANPERVRAQGLYYSM